MTMTDIPFLGKNGRRGVGVGREERSMKRTEKERKSNRGVFFYYFCNGYCDSESFWGGGEGWKKNINLPAYHQNQHLIHFSSTSPHR